jgi:hypothetical protein
MKTYGIVRDYVALAIAAIPAVNREDFRRVYLSFTAEPNVKNARYTAQKNLNATRREFRTAWGDMWAKPGWDVVNVLTRGKEYLLVSWGIRIFPVRVVRAGVGAMLGRHAQIRKGQRNVPYCPKITIE